MHRMTGRPFVRSLSSSARCAASLRLDAAGLALLETWNKMEKGFQFFFKKNGELGISVWIREGFDIQTSLESTTD